MVWELRGTVGNRGGWSVYEQQPEAAAVAGWLTLTEPSAAEGPPGAPAASACESINRALISLKTPWSAISRRLLIWRGNDVRNPPCEGKECLLYALIDLC